MKKQYRESEDAWEGFDGREVVYNEKEEKKYESTVWKYLLGVAIIMLLIVVFKHVEEIRLYTKGHCIEAVYMKNGNGTEVARYINEDNRLQIFDITGMNAVHDGERVKLYYMENINTATPMTRWTEWALYYIFFGVLLCVSLWRIFRVYKK